MSNERKIPPPSDIAAASQPAVEGGAITKVEVDQNLCIGAASCVAVAPGVFELNADNKAQVKDPKGADDETIMLASKSCPVLAIKVYGKDGKQIFPE